MGYMNFGLKDFVFILICENASTWEYYRANYDFK